MKKGSGSKGWITCVVATLIVVIAVVLLAAILALNTYKPRKPVTSVDSIKLEDMDFNLNIFKLSVNVNVTLNVDVSVNNTNKFGFKYYDSSAQLNYRGELIGEATIPNGELLPMETMGLNLTLTIMADRFISNPQVPKDAASGTLPLNALIKILGKVNILGFIEFHASSTSSCDFTVNLFNRTVGDHECQSNAKISEKKSKNDVNEVM
ncbi:Late embryogenesis abundant protein, partial [Mucuna pruriens]